MPPFDAEGGEERLVCAVLAAQVAALRDRLEGGATVEMLWNASDALGGLVKLARERACGVQPDMPQPTACEATLSAVARVSDTLDDLAFVQAQRVDLARQMADCVVTALQRLAASDAPPGARLQIEELAALYVSEDQRQVHGEVAGRLQAATAPDGAEPPHAGRAA